VINISGITALTELDVGDVFDDGNNTIYTIEKKLGKGGMGLTYLVTNNSNNEKLVAKIPLILQVNYEEDAYHIEKLKNEALILQKLKENNIPNVVKIKANIPTTKINGLDVPVLVMEFAKGKTCNDCLKDTPSSCFKEAVVKTILIKIATALNDVHKLGFIHRDIKPENIFVDQIDRDPQITLIDFGIAAAFNQSSCMNQATHVGTPFYGPPEQRENGIFSPSSDVFALGATGFQLATGRILQGVRGKYNPKDYEQRGYPVSQEFANVIIKATWPDMLERFPIMEDFLNALNGKPPLKRMKRIIADGKQYPITKDIIIIGRANSNINPPPDIEVVEYSQPGENFLSRRHCTIKKGADGFYRLYDTSVNGTVWLNNNKEWKPVPKDEKNGLILANIPLVIGLGYCDVPTGKFDMNGNEILPGAYRVIEYRPPDKPGTAVSSQRGKTK